MASMRPRGWVTLIIRLVGLASVLWGVYVLISTIDAASSMASIGEIAKDTPLAGMFKAENYQPSYVGPALWIGAGALLMIVSARLVRFLFSGIETPEPTTAQR
jgi:hypothetical protein